MAPIPLDSWSWKLTTSNLPEQVLDWTTSWHDPCEADSSPWMPGSLMNQLFINGNNPEWLTLGRAVLIRNGPSIQLPTNDTALGHIKASVGPYIKDEQACGSIHDRHVRGNQECYQKSQPTVWQLGQLGIQHQTYQPCTARINYKKAYEFFTSNKTHNPISAEMPLKQSNTYLQGKWF